MKQFIFGVIVTLALINYNDIKQHWFAPIPPNAENLTEMVKPVKVSENTTPMSPEATDAFAKLTRHLNGSK